MLVRNLTVALFALSVSSCVRHRAIVRAPSAPQVSPVARTMARQTVNTADAGDGDYSAKILRARVDANPRDLAARLELARYYQRAGFPEVAIEHLRLACERAPESEAARIALAKVLRDTHRPAEAASTLRI